MFAALASQSCPSTCFAPSGCSVPACLRLAASQMCAPCPTPLCSGMRSFSDSGAHNFRLGRRPAVCVTCSAPAVVLSRCHALRAPPRSWRREAAFVYLPACFHLASIVVYHRPMPPLVAVRLEGSRIEGGPLHSNGNDHGGCGSPEAWSGELGWSPAAARS